MLNKKEIQLLLTFLVIYGYFMHWGGWNENSRFDLTRAIVDEHRFEIDSFHKNTGDRSYFKAHYYSDKVPGMSFIGVPIYIGSKFFHNYLLPESMIDPGSGDSEYVLDGNTFSEPISPGSLVLLSMISLTLFTSVLSSALTVVLIYKISRYFVTTENHRTLLALAYGLSSTPFHTALVFFGHATGTFFAFLGLYLVYRVKKNDSNLNMMIPGFLSGLALVVETSVIFLVLFTAAAVLSMRRKNQLINFFIGISIGVLPLLTYNLVIFGNPLVLPRLFVDPEVWPLIQGNKGIVNTGVLPDPAIILNLTITPSNGLFFYNPILILSLIGLSYMYRDKKFEAIVIVLLFFLFLNFLSRWWMWWGGTFFGPRHLLPIIPILFLPLSYAITRVNKSVVILLLILSLFVSAIGLQEYENNVMPKLLKDHYLPLFLQNGPRSRIFENLLDDEVLPIDIRDCAISKGEYDCDYLRKTSLGLFTILSIGTATLKVPFLCLVPLLSVIALIWRREFLGYLWPKGIDLRCGLLLILGIMVLSSIFFLRIA